MGSNKPPARRSLKRNHKPLPRLLDPLNRRNYRGLHLEPLEERRLLNANPHVLAGGNFSQDWSNPALINVINDWNGVPSIIGYAGAGLSGEGTDPRTITAA